MRTTLRKNKKRVFVIHGYRSWPGDCWFGWLKRELEKKGFLVVVPRMPNPAKPRLKPWLSKIGQSVGVPDVNTYLVGHSLGVIAILRYLESLKRGEKIGGMISVGGRVLGRTSPKRAASFFKEPIRWRSIRQRCKKAVGLYSLDDPLVSTENGRLLKTRLGAKLILEKRKGHFSRDDKVFRLPSALKAIRGL